MLDLATLVAPLSPSEFLDRHWPDDAWWETASETRAAGIAAIPELASAEAAMAGARAVTVFRPDGRAGVVPGGEAALPLYKLGLTCYLPSTSHIPALTAAKEQLTADLGLPAGSIACEVFCSDGPSGVKMHSDFDVNFAVLIRGRKTWTIAPNRHIRNPTGLCVPSTREQPGPRQLELADETPFPDAMPAGATTVEMRDGGALFLPRGWWHETSAEGTCLQVNFVVKRPFWMSIAGGAVTRLLESDPEWRGLAYDVFGPADRREAAVARLAAIIPALRSTLDGLLAGDDEEVARRLLEAAPMRPPGTAETDASSMSAMR